MSSLLLLMGLLVVAYLGSFLVSDRSLRGVGLPSSVEWVVLGFVLGPHALGVISPSLIDSVEPVVVVGLGWLLLVEGLAFATGPRGRVSARRILLSLAWGTASGVAVGVAVYYAVPHLAPQLAGSRLVIAVGIAATSTETTRHVMRWVDERYGAAGPLFDLLRDLADAEDLVPIAGVVAVFVLAPRPAGFPIDSRLLVPVTVGLGLVLGCLFAALIGREFRLRETWGVVLGTSMLGIGVSFRAGLPVVAVLFGMGVTIAAVSRHAGEVRAMLVATERSALLPILILCGVRLDAQQLPRVLAIIGVALGARIASKYLLGSVVSTLYPPARPAGGLVGLAMMSSGALSMCIGLLCALRFHGPTGNVILASAAAVCVVGELVGPPSLRASLRRAGELHPLAPATRSSRPSQPPEAASADEGEAS